MRGAKSPCCTWRGMLATPHKSVAQRSVEACIAGFLSLLFPASDAVFLPRLATRSPKDLFSGCRTEESVWDAPLSMPRG
jgi:hypothetical protein